jgi:hypothetical protein
MVVNNKSSVRATGGCLCEEVQYEIHGPLYDVLKCHCSKCRRTHGHVAAYAHTLTFSSDQTGWSQVVPFSER